MLMFAFLPLVALLPGIEGSTSGYLQAQQDGSDAMLEEEDVVPPAMNFAQKTTGSWLQEFTPSECGCENGYPRNDWRCFKGYLQKQCHRCKENYEIVVDKGQRLCVEINWFLQWWYWFYDCILELFGFDPRDKGLGYPLNPAFIKLETWKLGATAGTYDRLKALIKAWADKNRDTKGTFRVDVWESGPTEVIRPPSPIPQQTPQAQTLWTFSAYKDIAAYKAQLQLAEYKALKAYYTASAASGGGGTHDEEFAETMSYQHTTPNQDEDRPGKAPSAGHAMHWKFTLENTGTAAEKLKRGQSGVRIWELTEFQARNGPHVLHTSFAQQVSKTYIDSLDKNLLTNTFIAYATFTHESAAAAEKALDHQVKNIAWLFGNTQTIHKAIGKRAWDVEENVYNPKKFHDGASQQGVDGANLTLLQTGGSMHSSTPASVSFRQQQQ